MYKKEENVWQKHLDFIILDTIWMQGAYILSYILRHGAYLPYSTQEYRNLGLIIILLQICMAFLGENYKNILRRGYFEEFRKVFLQVSLLMMIIFVYLFLIKSSEFFSRSVLFQMWGWGCLFLYIGRISWKTVIRKRMNDGAYLQKMMMISQADRVEETVKTVLEKKYRGYEIVGILLADTGKDLKKVCGLPVLGDADDIEDVLRREVVDEVFLDLPLGQELKDEICRSCTDMGITVHLNIGKKEKDAKVIVQNYAEHMVLTYSIKFAEPRQLLIKRVMDIFGGIAGLLITVILTIFLGPIIYIQSPGPVFFSQERVGRNGRKFRIYKFRSMYPDAEKRKKELMDQNKMKGLMFKMDNDPRIIPIGHFIRKTSLDEFPQFWNVLKGDMSLVGTRPPTVDEYEQYKTHHKARLAAKPGLTGMWQVSGRSNIIDFEEVVRLDMTYISEWTIGLDIRILLQTIKIVFTGKGSV